MIHVNIYPEKGGLLYNQLLKEKVLINNSFSINVGVKPNIGETLSINNLNVSNERLQKFLSRTHTLYFKVDDIIQSYLITEGDNGITVLDLKCTLIEKPF
ncbi:hypothetical protein SAMN05443667_101233 [Flavobacterium gillisiae]|uniref:Uncharacterized protein n=1 Tax=Flavobacterium gillisiae TaxID=150146 RepID=A0A1H3WTD9_9FLAO|nr:hypothetical protein [Flavobacterium gillisiae]SDZ90399.1 hypothetical protein SAMN05443667_101233 [Flavobacterium gillisiae]